MVNFLLNIFRSRKNKTEVQSEKFGWENIDVNVKKSLLQTVKITGVYETISAIRETIEDKKFGAYLRFGDGDVMLLNGLSEMMHDSNPNLALEMEEAFLIKSGELHKSLAIHSKIFGYEVGMKPGMHLISNQDALNFLERTYSYFNHKPIYSPVALHYLAVFDLEKCIEFLKFLKANNPIFVGNRNVDKLLIHRLFSNELVEVPPRNSYAEIDRIETELCEILEEYKGNFKVVVIAMGCAGRILQKRILKKGYNVYLFDFGSLLDAFNGLETRTWIKMSGLTNLQKIIDRL